MACDVAKANLALPANHAAAQRSVPPELQTTVVSAAAAVAEHLPGASHQTT